jgi:beta-galactosidase
MVFIANHWSTGSVTDVRVFSNTDEVELSVNGRSLGRQKPDSNVNTSHLAYPPFTFHVPAFESGTLRAVGYIDGAPVERHEVTTPGEPSRLSLDVDYSGVPVSREHDDLVFVYASVLDTNGHPVPYDSSEVHFEIEGDALIVGPETVRAEAGIATILVRTKPSSSTLTVHAESTSLDADTIEIRR